MAPWKWLGIWFATVTAALSAVGAFNFAMDPYQMFRPDTVYSTNHRYTDIGLIRHGDFDGMLIGASCYEFYDTAYFDEKTGGKMQNLTVSFSSPYENRQIAGYALRTRDIKTVLYGLDYPTYRGGPDNINPIMEMPGYLYDDNPFNDLTLVLSLDTLRVSCDKYEMVHGGGHRPGLTDDRNLIHEWYYREKDDFVPRKVYEDWMKKRPVDKADKDRRLATYDLEEMERSFDSNVLTLVKEHPETTFIITHTPYYTLFHYQLYEASPDMLDMVLRFKRHVYEKLRDCPNARLHDLQLDFATTNDISNYKDMRHFKPEVTRRMTDMITSGRFLVTDDNIDRFELDFRDNVVSFDLAPVLAGKS